MWEKEKMLVTSIFSFSHNIFQRLLFLRVSIFSFIRNIFYPSQKEFLFLIYIYIVICKCF